MRIAEGQKYNRLTAVCFSGNKDYWIFRCDCGTQKIIRVSHVKNGHTKSCGCYQSERSAERVNNVRPVKENYSKNHPLTYSRWHGMMTRAGFPSSTKKRYWGAIGIIVCERWRSFINFLADMGECPGREYSLDRYPDRNGNYELGNCRWATRDQQIANQNPRGYHV